MIFGPLEKLLWNGNRVQEWLETGRSKPILIEVAPTGFCNASCPWCFFNGKHEKVMIDPHVMLRTIGDMCELGVRAINWTGGGEPTIHPQFENFVNLASKLMIKQGLFTNGFVEIPNSNNFEWIRISVTDKGIARIKRPHVPFGICVNQTNEQTRNDLKNLCLEAKDFGATYFQVRPALMGSWDTQPKLKPPIFLKKYSTRDFKVYVTEYKYSESTKNKKYPLCYGYHFCPSIDWNGNVSSCLYLTQNPHFQFGNLNNNSLTNIWESRRPFLSVFNQCQNCCKNHEINKVLYNATVVRDREFV